MAKELSKETKEIVMKLFLAEMWEKWRKRLGETTELSADEVIEIGKMKSYLETNENATWQELINKEIIEELLEKIEEENKD